MTAFLRYLKLYRSFLANSLSRTMEFRGQFFMGIFAYLIWNSVSLLFIEVIFGRVGAVASWTRNEMWVLYGTYIALESLCYGLIGPNMWRFSPMVRDGSLDLALTRPVATQFLVSLRYIDLNGALNVVVGLALIGTGLYKIGSWPSPLDWTLWLLLLICGFIIAYAIWFICVTISIWAVKMEGIAVLFDPMMQMARFPLQIYPQRLQPFLLTVLPVAFLTTVPAQALLGRVDMPLVALALVMAVFTLACSHWFFNYALRFYGSASS